MGVSFLDHGLFRGKLFARIAIGNSAELGFGLFDLDSGKWVMRMLGDHVYVVELSHSGKLLAVGASEHVYIFSVHN